MAFLGIQKSDWADLLHRATEAYVSAIWTAYGTSIGFARAEFPANQKPQGDGYRWTVHFTVGAKQK